MMTRSPSSCASSAGSVLRGFFTTVVAVPQDDSRRVPDGDFSTAETQAGSTSQAQLSTSTIEQSMKEERDDAVRACTTHDPLVAHATSFSNQGYL